MFYQPHQVHISGEMSLALVLSTSPGRSGEMSPALVLSTSPGISGEMSPALVLSTSPGRSGEMSPHIEKTKKVTLLQIEEETNFP